MTAYILRRLLQLVPVLAGITLACFVLLRVLPGDPASLALGARAGEAEVQAFRKRLGIDQPLPAQFVAFVRQIADGSLGQSIRYERPVRTLVFERLPATLLLVGASTVLAIVLTLPLALLAAARRQRWPDTLLKAFFSAVLAVPSFWLGLVLVLLLSIWLPLFPTSGWGDGFWSRLHHLVLPALTLAAGTAALTFRSLRAGLVAVMKADYIDTARAKGKSDAYVLWRHVLPNSLIGTISIIGVHCAWLIGGTVVIETVFAVPGVGQLFVDSIYARDYPTTQGLTIVFAVLVVLINLATDLAYAAADPRVRLQA